MNRRERRAQKAQRKKGDAHVAPEVAIHEAGHALARYLTAGEMGIPASESIERIDIHESPTNLGTVSDGAASLSSQATTYGPMFSADIAKHQQAVMDELSLPGARMIEGKDAGEMLTKTVKRASAAGVDIEQWLKAKALIAVFGAVTEGLARGVPPTLIFDGYECEGDMNDFIRDCILAEVSGNDIQNRLDDAFKRASEIMSEQRNCDAINTLAETIRKHGSITGQRAITIIERELNK